MLAIIFLDFISAILSKIYNQVNPELSMMLQSMGFTSAQAERALRACDNNGDRAAEWLFSHADDMDLEGEGPEASGGEDAMGLKDGKGTYRLFLCGDTIVLMTI